MRSGKDGCRHIRQTFAGLSVSGIAAGYPGALLLKHIVGQILATSNGRHGFEELALGGVRYEMHFSVGSQYMGAAVET